MSQACCYSASTLCGLSKEIELMREQRNGTLTQAMALLLHNQAELVAQMAQVNKDRAQTDQRFRDIERTIEEMKSILAHHDVILRQIQETLQGLPEAVRQKIGFKPR
jgi:hypothetical protein